MRLRVANFALPVLACFLVLAGCSRGEVAEGVAAPAEAAAEGAGAEGEGCGGIRGLVCAEPLWCDPEPGFCDGADIDGTCIAVPEICTKDYRPVCGCDGKTWGNDCTRRAARIAKDHDGECAGTGG